LSDLVRRIVQRPEHLSKTNVLRVGLQGCTGAEAEGPSLAGSLKKLAAYFESANCARTRCFPQLAKTRQPPSIRMARHRTLARTGRASFSKTAACQIGGFDHTVTLPPWLRLTGWTLWLALYAAQPLFAAASAYRWRPSAPHFPLSDTPEHHAGEFHALARCRNAMELGHVRSRPASPHGDEVTFGKDVLDGDMEVGEHPLERPDVLFHALWPKPRARCVVVEVVRHLCGNRGRIEPIDRGLVVRPDERLMSLKFAVHSCRRDDQRLNTEEDAKPRECWTQRPRRQANRHD
jgi:hypothetical protein